MVRNGYLLAAALIIAGVFATALGTEAPHTPDPAFFEPDSDDPFYGDGYCGACHKLHGASGGELWATGSTVNELCEHCHNSTATAPKADMEMMTHMARRAEPNCDFCVHTFEVTCTSCHEPHAHEKNYERSPGDGGKNMFLRTKVKLWKLGCGDAECGLGEHHDDVDKSCTADESCDVSPCTGKQTCELNPSGNETICVCPIGGDGTCADCLVSAGLAKFEVDGDGCRGSACTGPGADCGYGVCVEECSTVTNGCAYHVDIGDLINPKDWNEGECVSSSPTCTENGTAGPGLFDRACWGPAGVCQTTPIDNEPYCDCPIGGAGEDCKSGGGADGCAPGFEWDGAKCVNYTCALGDETLNAGAGALCGYGANCDVSSVCQADSCGESSYWDETLGTPACVGFDTNAVTRVLQGDCTSNPCPGGALGCTDVEGGKGHICECPVGTALGSADCTACAGGFTWSSGLEQCVPDCGGASEGDPCGYGGGCTGTCPTVAATCAGGEYYDDAGGGCTTNESCAVGVNCFNGGTCEQAPFDGEFVCNCPLGTTGADCAGGTATEGQGCDASRAYVYSGGACVVDCEAAGKADGNACGFGGQCKPGAGGAAPDQRPSADGCTGCGAAAYDGNLGTAADVASNITLNLNTVNNPGCSGTTSSVVLKMQWDCAGCVFDTSKASRTDNYTIQYTINGGGSWTNWVTNSSANVGTTVSSSPDVSGTLTTCASIASQVQFQVVHTQQGSPDGQIVHVDEAWVEVSTSGGGGLSCDKDYGTAGCDTGYTGTACDACNGTTHNDYGNRACESTDPATTCGGCGTGSCWDHGGVGVCDCPDTFTGADCSVCGEAITLGCTADGDSVAGCDTGYGGAACDACAGTHVATADGQCVTNSGSNGPLACDTNPCVGGVDSSQGTCARAANGTAMCVCTDKWGDSDCNTCAATDDTPVCNVDKGTAGCDAGYQNDGAGGFCNDCAVGYTRYPDGTCKDTDPCAPVTCLNGGTCYVDSTGAGVCDCPGRYTGDQCQNETGCSPGTTCDCDEGYDHGAGNCDACDTANGYVAAPDGTCVLDPCRAEVNPCKNGSSCFVGASGDAECDCFGQYYGPAGECEVCDLPSTVTEWDFDAPGNRLGLARGTGSDLCEVCHTATAHFQAASHPITTPSTGTENDKAATGDEHSAAGVDLRGKDCVGCHIHKLVDAQAQGTVAAQGAFGFVPVAGATNTWRGGAETAPSSCEGCHLADPGAGSQDVDSYRWNGAKSMIDGDEWAAYGHGVPYNGTYPSGNTYSAMDGPSEAAFSAQPDNGCDYCHDKNVPHNNPDNFFRLRNVDALQRGVCGIRVADKCFDGTTDCVVDADCEAGSGEPANDVCNVCHLTSGGGYDPDTDSVPGGPWAKITSSLVIDAGTDKASRHFGTKHGAGGKGGRFCWDCHDPHGDLSADGSNPNYFMIQRRPTIDHASPDGLGRPWDPDEDDVFPATVSTVDGLGMPVKFDPVGGTDGGAWDLEDYDAEGTNGVNSVCRSCHLTTVKNCADQVSGPCAGNNHPEGDGTGGDATPGCVEQCHPHELQFGGQAGADQNCFTCHASGIDVDTDDYALGAAQGKISIDEFGGRDSTGAAQTGGVGHGRTTSYASGNAGAAFGQGGTGSDPFQAACYYCHTTDTGKAHPAAASYALGNPFMLAIDEACGDGTGICGGDGNKVVGGDGTWNDICLRCHSDTVTNPGYDPPADGQANDAPPLCTGDDCVLQSLDTPMATTAHTHATSNTNGMRCWHCHDPHGDANNAYMIHLNAFNVMHPGDPCTAAGGSSCAGELPIDSVIGDTNGLTNDMSFPASGAPIRADYIEAEGSGTGPVCGQCHPAPQEPIVPEDVDYCNQTSCNGTTHQSAEGACTNCHTHEADFQGLGNCVTCHGTTTGDVLDYSAGGTRALIDMGEWADTGHGRLAGSGNYDSNNGAANFAGDQGCYYCHLENWDDPDGGGPLAAHPTSTTYAWDNPFLLRGAGGNDVCNVCHATGGGGVDPGPDFEGADAPELCNPECATTVGSSHAHGLSKTGEKCWHCHDPHGDGNDYMIQLNAFSNIDAGDPCIAAGGTTGCADELPIDVNKGNGASFGLTLDISFQPNGVPSADTQYTGAAGVCRMCHQTGATGKCNQTDCSAAPSGSHSGGSPCTGCHSHSGDFAGEGDCIGCHTGEVDIVGGLRDGQKRRGVGPDFADGATAGSERSHHVRRKNGAVLTVHDCVMCHAEGYSNGRCTANGNTECSIVATPCETDADCVQFNSNKHKNKVIDLRNVDSTTPHNATTDATLVPNVDYFPYDKDSIDPSAPPWAVGPTSNWSANNPTWVTETRDHLDPFCLTCHDSDGAAGQAAQGELGAATQALNPFADDAITNESDLEPRGAVVDVASQVSTQANHNSRNYATGTTGSQLCILIPVGDTHIDTAMDDPYYEWRCASDGTTTCTPDAFGQDSSCGSYSPRDGYYSRHAIRGQSSSLYDDYLYCDPLDSHYPDCSQTPIPSYTGSSKSNPEADGAVRSMWYATANDGDATYRIVRTGVTPSGESPQWNDTSLMSCADCHTTDGANDTAGNAHGSDSEYLLLDRNRGALEGVNDDGVTGNSQIVCYQCHAYAAYNVANGKADGHADDNTLFAANGSLDPVLWTGSARAAGKGDTTAVLTVFGIVCTQCHGGTSWGSIHGTSENPGGGDAAEFPERAAYRFMNGAGIRYYLPANNKSAGGAADWMNLTEGIGCYTVASTDTFGGCTAHSGGTGRAPMYTRPLRY